MLAAMVLAWVVMPPKLDLPPEVVQEVYVVMEEERVLAAPPEPTPVTTQPPPESVIEAPVSGVGAFEGLIQTYFEPEWWPWARRVMACESGGNPNAVNPTSGAAGLFQHLPSYWPGRAAAAGFPGASPFNPEANIAASAYLLRTGGPGHWVCK